MKWVIIFLIKKLLIQVPICCKAAVCKGATAAINGEDLLQWQEGVITPSRGLISSSQHRNNIQPVICTTRHRARSFYAMTGVASCMTIMFVSLIKLWSQPQSSIYPELNWDLKRVVVLKLPFRKPSYQRPILSPILLLWGFDQSVILKGHPPSTKLKSWL